MKTKIILPLLALALLLAACGKNERPAGKNATRGKVAASRAKPDADFISEDMFSITRNGERVTIRWDADLSAYKGIRILRNSTGIEKDRQPVANLPANSKEYVDIAPDARVQWYWISLGIGGRQTKSIGPIRAKADAGKTGNYTKASQNVSLIAQRTRASVVVAWDLPDEKYKSVVIKRNNKPSYTRNQRTNVFTTKEWRGDVVDKLPDPNADYWYWVDAIRENGTVISQGPIKAVYASADDIVASRPASNAKAKTKGTPKGNGKGKGNGNGKTPGKGAGKAPGKGKNMGVPKINPPAAGAGMPPANQTTAPVGSPKPNEDRSDYMVIPEPNETSPDVLEPGEE